MQEHRQDSTTRDAILRSGKKWFLEKGFKSAPLRSILKDTGFTSGAFYGYFDSKEDLFCALVDGTAQAVESELQEMYDELHALPPEKDVFGMTKVFEDHLERLVAIMFEDRDAVRLILRCSEGTRYENFLGSHIERDRGLGTDVASSMDSPVSQLSMQILYEGYFSMLGSAVLRAESEEEATQVMRDIQDMYFSGMLALLEKRRQKGSGGADLDANEGEPIEDHGNSETKEDEDVQG